MHNCSHSIADLLPHAPPMVLLDEVLGWDQGRISTVLTVRSGIPFFVDGEGVPAYAGLEYMAQSCGAYAGIEGLNHGQPIRLGFLLGTRNFHASVDWFRSGNRLVIDAVEIFREELMGAFDCRITLDAVEVASATLNLYQPKDAPAAAGNLLEV